MAVAAISIMSCDVHTLRFSTPSQSASSAVTSHQHHEKLSVAPIHDVCIVDSRGLPLMILGLIDGTCNVFSLSEPGSTSSLVVDAPRLLLRIAVGYSDSAFCWSRDSDLLYQLSTGYNSTFESIPPSPVFDAPRQVLCHPCVVVLVHANSDFSQFKKQICVVFFFENSA